MHMQYFQDLREFAGAMFADTNDPHIFHAMMLHFPIAISMLGLPMVILLVVTRNRSGWVRWLTVSLYALGIVAALVTADAGGDARQAPNTRIVEGETKIEFETHARMGNMVWMFMAATAVCVTGTMLRVKFLRLLFPISAVVAALLTAGWVAATAYHGGQLVYVEGVGVPRSANNLVAPLNPSQTQPASAGPRGNPGRSPRSRTRPAASAPPTTAP